MIKLILQNKFVYQYIYTGKLNKKAIYDFLSKSENIIKTKNGMFFFVHSLSSYIGIKKITIE